MQHGSTELPISCIQVFSGQGKAETPSRVAALFPIARVACSSICTAQWSCRSIVCHELRAESWIGIFRSLAEKVAHKVAASHSCLNFPKMPETVATVLFFTGFIIINVLG